MLHVVRDPAVFSSSLGVKTLGAGGALTGGARSIITWSVVGLIVG